MYPCNSITEKVEAGLEVQNQSELDTLSQAGKILQSKYKLSNGIHVSVYKLFYNYF